MSPFGGPPAKLLETLPERLIRRHEGYRRHAYQCPAGYWTIGIGRNIDRNGPGITLAEAEVLLRNDLIRLAHELDAALPWWRQQDPVRRAVMLDLAFNLGTTKLLTFRRTLNSWQQGDYAGAATQLLQSAYAQQVPSRAGRNAVMLRTGDVPAELTA